MIPRFIRHKLLAALSDTRVVLLNGARQTGKSTLVQQFMDERQGRYLTLDDPATAGTARSDPMSLVRNAGNFLVIDEVQHAPELFPAIKRVVDADGRPGRFLLTGSANVFLVPRMSESLAGRIEILPLNPLSQGEMTGNDTNLVDELFDSTPLQAGSQAVDRLNVCERMLMGGFPEVVDRMQGERRDAWFRSYVASLLQRDVRDLAQIDGLTELPRLLGLLAARSGALLNMSEVSRSTGIAHSTLRRYLALLEATFIFQPLPAWSNNLSKRFVKSPKIHLLDSGLAAHLRKDGDASVLARSPNLGPLLETFVVQEVRKLLAWSRQDATPYHFRTAAGLEVDLVLEARGLRIVGIEVKAASNIGQSDFRGLRALAETAGDKFAGGAVLYLGEQRLQFGDKLWALPVSALWESAGTAPAMRSPAPAYGSQPKVVSVNPGVDKLRISQTRVEELCRKYGIARLSLFGSASRNQLRPDSDVNLMADFISGVSVSKSDLAPIQDAFSEAFGGRKVAMTTPEILGKPLWRDSIVPDLKVIYEAQELLVRTE
jgi:predicted AAA+ superfamily ATPase/predicted nucleotidyltransferase